MSNDYQQRTKTRATLTIPNQYLTGETFINQQPYFTVMLSKRAREQHAKKALRYMTPQDPLSVTKGERGLKFNSKGKRLKVIQYTQWWELTLEQQLQ